MRNYWIVVCCSLMFTACNASDWEQSVDVQGVYETETIDRTYFYNLTISGLNNTVMVADENQINNLFKTGYNNMLTIGLDTNVDRFQITGADNTVYVPMGLGISFDDTSEWSCE